MGDSITTASGVWTDYGRLTITAWNGLGSYLGQAYLLPVTGDSSSSGQFGLGPVKANTGNKITDLLDTYIPAFLAHDPLPAFCVVLIGTNELGTMTSEEAIVAKIANLRLVYETLLDAGVIPVACGIPTQGQYDGLYRERVIDWNPRVEALATELDLPYVNFFTVTDDGADGWIDGYSLNDDMIHPSPLGAVAMGQLLRDTMETYLLAWAPTLVSEDTEAVFTIANGCFMADTDSDGVPDGWTVASGGDEISCSLVAGGDEAEGNWWRINKTAFTAESRLRLTATGLTAGAVYRCGFKMKIASADDTAVVNVESYNPSNSAQRHFIFSTGAAIQDPVAPFVFYHEQAAPSAGLRFDIVIQAGLVDVYIGQFTVQEKSQQHVYVAVENLALDATQRGELLEALQALGPDSDPQPANLCHWRMDSDDKGIFEASFGEDAIVIDGFRARLAEVLGVGTEAITDNTSLVTLDTKATDVVTFTYDGTDYLRVSLFGYDGTNWPTWEESRVEARAFVWP